MHENLGNGVFFVKKNIRDTFWFDYCHTYKLVKFIFRITQQQTTTQ